VINLDDEHNEGTHWTAARVINGILYYADPFGIILNGWPPKELSQYPVIANRISFQRPSTALCGYYAELFAKKMNEIDKPISQKAFERALWDSIA
jgi:hypothetical protein